MKATGGKANPAQLNELLKTKLAAAECMTATRCTASCSSGTDSRPFSPPGCAWRALIEHRQYPDAIRETLGEAWWPRCYWPRPSNLKCLSLQLQATGRCISCWRSVPAAWALEFGSSSRCRHRRLLENPRSHRRRQSHVTLETDDGAQRYQASFHRGERLADSLQAYFRTRSNCRRGCGCMRMHKARRACCCRNFGPSGDGRCRGDRRRLAPGAAHRRYLDAGRIAHAGGCGNFAPAVQ